MHFSEYVVRARACSKFSIPLCVMDSGQAECRLGDKYAIYCGIIVASPIVIHMPYPTPSMTENLRPVRSDQNSHLATAKFPVYGRGSG